MAKDPVVLVIDPDEKCLRSTARALRSFRVPVGCVRSVGEAKASMLAAEYPPQVIVLALAFPGGPERGLSAIQELRALAPCVAVILHTARFERDHERRTFGEGAVAYLEKGDFDQFRLVVAAALDVSRLLVLFRAARGKARRAISDRMRDYRVHPAPTVPTFPDDPDADAWLRWHTATLPAPQRSNPGTA